MKTARLPSPSSLRSAVATVHGLRPSSGGRNGHVPLVKAPISWLLGRLQQAKSQWGESEVGPRPWGTGRGGGDVAGGWVVAGSAATTPPPMGLAVHQPPGARCAPTGRKQGPGGAAGARRPLLLSSSLAERKWNPFLLQLNGQIRGPRGSQPSLCPEAIPPPTEAVRSCRKGCFPDRGT